jgi:hypothetical protein
MTDTHADGTPACNHPDNNPKPRVGRRKMILGVAAAGVGASVVAGAEPAGATDGNPVLIGKANTAKATTSVTTTKKNGLEGTTSDATYSGVEGVDTSGDGGYGVYGNSANGTGVYGNSANGTGVYGIITGDTSFQFAVEGSDQSTGDGGGVGVGGFSTNGTGVTGTSTNGTGVSGVHNTGIGNGVAGVDNSGNSSSNGVFGSSTNGFGVEGFIPDTGDNDEETIAVFGLNDAPSGSGVFGQAYGDSGIAVYGSGDGPGSSYGVFAISENADALFADGSATVIGSLSKGGGSFKIDHPLDPAGKYLYHSFVESPDMMNVYNGTVTLDGKGEATVELPEWFEALNRDYRYQLTAIGSPAPELHIARKVEDGEFSIAGGKAGQEVSWQVTGIRQDTWANANRIPVEVEKPEEDQGRYLHPELVDGGQAITALAKARKHRQRRHATPG